MNVLGVAAERYPIVCVVWDRYEEAENDWRVSIGWRTLALAATFSLNVECM